MNTDPLAGNPEWPDTPEEIWQQGFKDFRAGYPATWTPNLGPRMSDWSFSLWLGGWEEAKWLHMMKQAVGLGVAVVEALKDEESSKGSSPDEASS